ncbi:MAG: 30S ribosomal protein S20 [Gammaproteobacteria bacterium]
MANTIQAKKRIRQNTKRRLNNNTKRSAMRTFLKRVITAIEAKNKELATTELGLVSSILDKLVNKGLIHKNKAARHKSRLCLRIKAL